MHTKAQVYNILERGSEKRRTAETMMNAHSSRSHTVFTVTVHIKEAMLEEEVSEFTFPFTFFNIFINPIAVADIYCISRSLGLEN